jgi:hypothetical protein
MLPQAADGCLQYHENAPGSSASESSCPVLSCPVLVPDSSSDAAHVKPNRDKIDQLLGAELPRTPSRRKERNERRTSGGVVP